jgi:hypothetical protein
MQAAEPPAPSEEAAWAERQLQVEGPAVKAEAGEKTERSLKLPPL